LYGDDPSPDAPFPRGNQQENMSTSHQDFVSDAYGPRADAYLASAVHASGEDLDWMENLVRGCSTARALDLGCGGGHVSYRIAPHVSEVIAVDVSSQMLETVSTAAAERGLRNISVQQSAAETLPFDNQRFDFVLSRFSAHHWRDVEAALREARRVLAPGGRAIFVDSVAPAVALLDSHLQALELLRDPSHVRNYTVPEWTAALARAGFEVASIQPRLVRIEFSSWIARTRTPAPLVEAIRLLQQGAPGEVRDHFRFEADGSFLLAAAGFEARAVAFAPPA
jgi:ubiquinone/menaquinone biosynthesis C-methylase UbiE